MNLDMLYFDNCIPHELNFQLCRALSCLVSCRNGDQLNQNGMEGNIYTWDDALRKSTQEFQHHSYSLLTCNCHSFVANNLNRLGFSGGRWNVVSLAVLILFKGRWVDKGSIVKSYLPFLIVFPLGLAFGGWTFLQFWGMFVILLVSWFLLGSYCLKGLIQLWTVKFVIFYLKKFHNETHVNQHGSEDNFLPIMWELFQKGADTCLYSWSSAKSCILLLHYANYSFWNWSKNSSDGKLRDKIPDKISPIKAELSRSSET